VDKKDSKLKMRVDYHALNKKMCMKIMQKKRDVPMVGHHG
jgi:hypothetical protein